MANFDGRVELMIPHPKATARYAETWVRFPAWSFFSL